MDSTLWVLLTNGLHDPVVRLLAATHPAIVALFSAGYGLGSLLVIAVHFNNLLYTLMHPGFWLGDGIALPGVLAAISHYYRRTAERCLPFPLSWFPAFAATLYTVLQAAYSIVVTGTYAPPWSLAHSAFIWVLVYSSTHFVTIVALAHHREGLWPVELLLVGAGIALHLLLALLFVQKVLPVA